MQRKGVDKKQTKSRSAGQRLKKNSRAFFRGALMEHVRDFAQKRVDSDAGLSDKRVAQPGECAALRSNQKIAEDSEAKEN